jgi:hypothetical protein
LFDQRFQLRIPTAAVLMFRDGGRTARMVLFSVTSDWNT